MNQLHLKMTMVQVLSFSLLVYVVVASDSDSDKHCTPTPTLWKTLLSRTVLLRNENVPEEVIWCLHASTHPSVVGCMKLKRYYRVIRKSIRKCKKGKAPENIPVQVVQFVKGWSHRQRSIGIPEEAVCCVHGRVHLLFKNKQYTTARAALYAVQILCDSQINHCKRYAQNIPTR